jgi:CRISPR-associated protein Csd2
MSQPIKNRYEFIFIFDCENGNPNGDPDAGNSPRLDPQDLHGLVSDVSFKRRIRNYVQTAMGNQSPWSILVEHASNLNTKIAKAHEETGGMPAFDSTKKKWVPGKDKVSAAAEWLCSNFYDVRTFGAVLSTGPNAGQIRGAVQLSFARSVDPILPMDIAITRMAVADNSIKGQNVGSADFAKWESEQPEDELRTMGRKSLIPYGLYVGKGFISAHLAEKVRFTDDDLKLLFQAILNMYEHDRSASKGIMTVHPDHSFVFKHVGNDTNLEQRQRQAMLGCTHAHKLFDLVTSRISRNPECEAARHIADYHLPVLDDLKPQVPSGVEVHRMADLA